jgi:3-hydroxybutyryl-CoA dehydratase
MPLEPGAELEPFEIESVSAEAMRTLAALLRDPTPIHFAPEVVAETMGLGHRVINQGPANLAYVMNALLANAPEGRIERIEVSFRGNVLDEQHVTAGGTVTSVDDGAVSVDVQLDADGTTALQGTAVIRETR